MVATKEEVKAQLTAAGIAFPADATLKALIALVPKDQETEDEKESETDEFADASVVSVAWKGESREYSQEVHGDDFVELAKEFAGKFGGTITKIM